MYSLAAQDQMRNFMSNSIWPCRFEFKQSNASVVVRVDNSERNFETQQVWTLNVTYDISLYGVSTTPYQVLTGQVATINYDKVTNYTDIFSKLYEGALRAEVKITAVAWTPAGGSAQPIPSKYNNDIFFDVIQETERFYNMEFNGVDCTPLASIPAPLVTTTVTASSLTQLGLASSNNQLPIAWNYIPGAESYDVEWLFVDIGMGTTPPAGGYNLDFRNATRINTPQQHFEIPMAFPNGILVYRVRGVGFSNIEPFNQ